MAQKNIPTSQLDLTNFTMNGNVISNVGVPVATGDAATKQYVDGVAAGLDTKPSVRAATTANITLSAPQTIDGVSVVAGNRVLVKNQTAPAENGIYIVNAGTWTRATDMDDILEFPGAYTFIEQGSTLADTGWVCTTDTGGTLGTTAITWTQFTGAGGGEANTASNVGVGGVGVFKQKTGIDLEFKNINAGSNKITITNDVGNNEVDIDVAQSNLSIVTTQLTTTVPSGRIFYSNGTGVADDANLHWNDTTDTLSLTAAATATIKGGQDTHITIAAGNTTTSGTAARNTTVTGGTPTDGDGGNVSILASNAATNTATTRSGGTLQLSAGNGVINGSGGLVILLAGNAAGSGGGGNMNVIAGSGGSTGVGGTTAVAGGNGGSTSGAGGSVSLLGGNATSGTGGDIQITGGVAGGANRGGKIAITGGTNAGTTTVTDAVLIQAGSTTNASASGSNIEIRGGTHTNASGTGGTATLVGGGPSGVTSVGGAAVVAGGNGGATGGNATIQGGTPTSSGDGGDVLATGGNGFGTNKNGGDAIIRGGIQTGTGLSGHILLNTFNSSGDVRVGPVSTGSTVAKFRSMTHSAGDIASADDAITSQYVLRAQTVDATQTEIFLDGATSTKRLTLVNDSTWNFEIRIAARRTDANDESAGYVYQGVIDRNATAATTAIVGTVAETILAEDTAAWSVSVDADTTNGSLRIRVTGEAAKTINWVAFVRTVEAVG